MSDDQDDVDATDEAKSLNKTGQNMLDALSKKVDDAFEHSRDKFDQEQKDARAAKSRSRTAHKIINTVIIIGLVISAVGALYWAYNYWFVDPEDDDKLNSKMKTKSLKAFKQFAATHNIGANNVAQPTKGNPITTQSKGYYAFYAVPERTVIEPAPPTSIPAPELLSLDDAVASAAVDIGWIRARSSNGDDGFVPNPEQAANFPINAPMGTLARALQDEVNEDAASKYCPNKDDIYAPPPINTCFRKCLAGQEFVIWRKPTESSYQYYCRPSCGNSPIDGKPIRMDPKQGFCERRRDTPHFMTDDKAIRLWWQTKDPNLTDAQLKDKVNNLSARKQAHAAICGFDKDGSARHLIGRHCYSMGDERTKSNSNWTPQSIRQCLDGFTPSREDDFVCAQCPNGMELRGIYPNYVCVEKCAPNTTDFGTGSALKCYPNAEPTETTLAKAMPVPETEEEETEEEPEPENANKK